ncbi:Short-chain alcohol dehydrogenase [Halanaeroarchaeum sp. HSR-CO]|uniref:SDR family oxidoreductase n=1 Tax=Halanaeroarchaeum sp. HSR-CO TaxID=2866382 RepID=UPI00217D05E8|nr:SDR family oxidoreductase [Halanaeroarchaeum sp. HSR-CO]UWG46364.1 Short-chain alcohol dehydrogenase [Halanaeroarchaeum sp. HSR-CO]
MDLELEDRRALVFAASKGLGRAAATELSRNGAEVTIASRDPENLATARDHIVTEAGVEPTRVHTLQCDLAVPADIETTIAAAVDAMGGLDVLVTNHGGPPVQSIAETDLETLDRTYEQVLRSTVLALKNALPELVRGSADAAVVNIVSATAAEPMAEDVLQAAFRPGIYALSKSLAEEYGPKGVRVNAVCPRGIVTDRLEDKIELLAEREDISTDAARKRRAAELPIRRLGDPPSFGKAVAFLSSPAADFVTGETLALDGGWLDGMSP